MAKIIWICVTEDKLRSLGEYTDTAGGRRRFVMLREAPGEDLFAVRLSYVNTDEYEPLGYAPLGHSMTFKMAVQHCESVIGLLGLKDSLPERDVGPAGDVGPVGPVGPDVPDQKSKADELILKLIAATEDAKLTWRYSARHDLVLIARLGDGSEVSLKKCGDGLLRLEMRQQGFFDYPVLVAVGGTGDPDDQSGLLIKLVDAARLCGDQYREAAIQRLIDAL